ncbi:helix-turn-helix domain-containing protein [Halegenticoccus tardaugens]|uniref:helix-turn-helix domain-containing protein n=1 Tax=Halegenticoccus tardaugens TaxID=2071624 RepID=UPI00100A5F83
MDTLDDSIDDLRSIELDNAFYVEDGAWIESLTVTVASDFDCEAMVDSISGVDLFSHRRIPSGPTGMVVERLIVTARESYPFILGLLLRQEAIPNRILLQNDRCRVVATVREWGHFRAVADDIQNKLGHFELQRVTQIDNLGEPLDSGRLSETLITKLTDEQLQLLETAYNMGYFAVPRRASATDVAEELDISQSNFSERIRTAENTLLGLIFGASKDDAPSE